MSFTSRSQVRFSQVDPAGIVFYPRYFEMLNVGIEDWFANVAGVDFVTLHIERRTAVPTVSLTSTFVAPSRLGDILSVELIVTKIGRSSCAYDYRISCEGELRLHGEVVLVCMDMETSKSRPWPEDVIQNMKVDDSAA